MKAATLFRRIATDILILAVSMGASTMTMADQDWSKLSKGKKTDLGLYMTAKQAYEHMQKHADKSLFLDVRTPAELNYLGAASVMDAHVPTVFMDRTQWNDKKHRFKRITNENFVSDVEARLKQKGLTKNDTVILMCRSGKRSAKAVNTLAKNGYTKVYSVVDGYEGDKSKTAPNKGKRTVNGWKNSGLPWTYILDRDLMYGVSK